MKKISGIFIFVLLAVWSMPCRAEIVPTSAGHQSTHVGRTITRARVPSPTEGDSYGLNTTTGLYSRGTDIYGNNGWTSAQNVIVGDQWLAFQIADITDIEALCLWNLGATGDQYGERNLTSFDIFIPATTNTQWLLPADGVSLTFSDASQFTSVASSLSVNADVYQTAHYFEFDIPDNTGWIFLANLSNNRTDQTGVSTVGIGKVAFLDSKITMPGNQISKAVASEEYDSRRTAANAIGTGGFYINPFASAGKEYAHRFEDSGTNWMSKQNPSEEWLAFDLGGVYDLEGLYFWNHSQYSNGARGVEDYVLYAISPSDVETLISKELIGSFDDLAGKTRAWFETNLDFVALDSISGTLDPALNQIAEAEYVSFNADETAWVLMYINSHYVVSGTDSAYVGLGQVRFDGSLSGSSDSAVPEPATWAMLLVGAVGLAICRRRGGKR